ncbi:molybdopterin-dependent oxidoreductase [bacterium]|jgi:DMSO/TMAO reductase YedYZ molybdopterin-dependent catalytic subunit|nr:molybdopterin-dependent oxidoreductase [Verrucomicrobiota bacterium]MDA7632816.1 molybdopterin-dependent oxidoreductase [bacterium]MDA7645170.1 molybdopterin-dependent oxidoreductase [bacterium]MDA7866941.1 molybdopterin-dependent oxidoreductase [Verrucomicrobiota bacterium]MDB4746012.1 molybdopterin-dependent oxidoreductase [Verrucomicrobiota bacterium]
MKNRKPITRRRALIGGMAAIGGGLGLSRLELTLPPTYDHLLRMGDAFTYGVHRVLLSGKALAREYPRSYISSFPATGTLDPANPSGANPSEAYGKIKQNNFPEWRLSVEGAVGNPSTFSLKELKAFPSRVQITKHICGEGWSAIGEWTGTQLAQILSAVEILPKARFVQFFTYDGWADGLDLLDTFHPQTLLAYGMNGKNLPIRHGAPVRLRVETQLGYKSLKFLERIVITEEFDDHGKAGSIQNGWAWYAGI